MATTPPPPGRVHTPPTPRHGPLIDPYEAYSPRRSSRVAARKNHLPDDLPTSSLHPRRQMRAITPTSTRKPTIARTSSQTFSPPSSPASPAKLTKRNPAKSRALRVSSAGLDSDSDAMPSRAESSLKPLGFDPRAMLPTPLKTPRKRPAESEAALSSTARVLFPSRPTNVEDVMPSPRKTRKGSHFSLALSSYEEEVDGGVAASKIQIYTDSKERVPSIGDEEENPFLSKNAKPHSRKARANFIKRRKSDEERAEEMEEAARNDEGVIYVFRGKKIFRRFDHPPTTESADAVADNDSDAASDDSIRRKAGASSRRPFTRSTIQPRLLFPNESQRRARETVDEEDEEAATDIEVPIPVPTPRKSTRYQLRQEAEGEILATPPAIGRATRSTTRNEAAEHETPTISDTSKLQPAEDTPLQVPMHATRSKKASPFDSWRRTKDVSKAVPKGTKRQAEPMERGEASGKRVKSGLHLDS